MENNNVLRCGSCVHFKDGPAHPRHGDLCSELGVRDYATAPDCYSPAPILIVRASVDVEAIGKLLRHLSAEQMQAMGQLITNSAVSLAEESLKWGQPVYVNLGGGEFLTSYFKGYVIGMTRVAGEGRQIVPHVYVSSDLTFEAENVPEHRTLLRFMPDSLFTPSKFRTIKENLIRQGKLESPKKLHSPHLAPLSNWLRDNCPMPTSKPELYEPPTIDSAPSAWLTPYSTDELDCLKFDPPQRKRGKTIVIIDDAAKKKQADRAVSRLNVVKVTNNDGTVTKVVTSLAFEKESEPEKIKENPLLQMAEFNRVRKTCPA